MKIESYVGTNIYITKIIDTPDISSPFLYIKLSDLII